MFLKNDYGQPQDGAGAAAQSDFARFLAARRANAPAVALAPHFPLPAAETLPWRARVRQWADDINLVPDLGQRIGSREWLRGLVTCFGLCLIAVQLRPDFGPLPAPVEPVADSATYDEVRSQMVTSYALGADSGRHMAQTDVVTNLTTTPERPAVNLIAAVGEGDSFAHALARAGVSQTDVAAATALVGMDVNPATLSPGTRLAITLGRRTSPNLPRPLDSLRFRARLDLALELKRVNGALEIVRTPIAVDSTPLRIQGTVSDSLYQAARSAGAPPDVAQDYLRVIAGQLSLDSIRRGDRFDLVVANRRAATGENETGDLLYAAYQPVSGKRIDMLRWTGGKWFEASGVGERRGGFVAPVSGHQTSGFGMRFHPILGYTRLHAGVDYGAPYGAPVYAVSDGIVTFAGRHGGHGNFIKLQHAGGIGTGYAHLSRMAAYAGQRVRQGQVIGYVGSSGLSTGPHLHYETYRNGVTVNPATISFSFAPQLSGRELSAFRARLAQLKGLSTRPAENEAGAAQLRTAIVTR